MDYPATTNPSPFFDWMPTSESRRSSRLVFCDELTPGFSWCVGDRGSEALRHLTRTGPEGARHRVAPRVSPAVGPLNERSQGAGKNRECAVGDIGALRVRPLLARDARERIKPMQSSPLAQLLKLPPSDRAELAIALWESLTDGEREEELALTDAQRAELDRRWAEHVKNPDSAVPWSDVRRKLLG